MDLIGDLFKDENPPLIVAELSGNHGNSKRKALELVERAVLSGADAVKIQTYQPDTITVKARDSRFLLSEGLWKGKYLDELYAEAMTPWEWHEELAQKAKDLGALLFSSPFDETAVDFLEKTLSPPLYKVASFEMNHFPLLKRIGRTGKPVLASTGVSTESEIQDSISTLRSNGCPQVVLLHCVSEYPAKIEKSCLRRMNALGERFQVPFGLSDHSMGHLLPVAATAMGAGIIEKHFTLDREDHSSDGKFSLLPEEFQEMATAVRLAHSSLGKGEVDGFIATEKSRHFKRSILVAEKISAGDALTNKNIRVARPGDGLCPSRWEEVLGKTSKFDLQIGHALREEDLNIQ